MGPFDLKRTAPTPPTPPLEATAKITNYNWSALAKAMSGGYGIGIDFESLRPEWKTTYRIWVYNASRMEHVVDHPVLGKVSIPANTTKKSYALYTSFPNVMKLPNQNLDENTLTTSFMRGEDFVKDLINPDHIYGKPVFKWNTRTAIGRDLAVKGVFYSMHNPPLRTEVLAAVTLMKKRYSDLLEQAAIMYASVVITEKEVRKFMAENMCSLEDALISSRRHKASLMLSPEHHAAANYFKVTTPWHPVLT